MLMDLTPLEDHIDLKDHYLAFIDLENFGVMEEVPDHRLSVRQVGTVQYSTVQYITVQYSTGSQSGRSVQYSTVQ